MVLQFCVLHCFAPKIPLTLIVAVDEPEELLAVKVGLASGTPSPSMRIDKYLSLSIAFMAVPCGSGSSLKISVTMTI